MNQIKKSGLQVEIVFFVDKSGDMQFLLLKRAKAKGGFWQPLTGGHHMRESVEEACRREALEEIGIEINVHKLIGPVHEFSFRDNNKDYIEKAYGYQLSLEEIENIKISDEHVEFGFFSLEEAVELLKWPENKKAVIEISQQLSISEY